MLGIRQQHVMVGTTLCYGGGWDKVVRHTAHLRRKSTPFFQCVQDNHVVLRHIHTNPLAHSHSIVKDSDTLIPIA